MPAAGGEQGQVLGAPPAVEEYVDLVLGHVEGVVDAALHEPDVRTVDVPQAHPDRGQRREPGGDLTGVAEVAVEHQRDQPRRKPAEPREDPLPLVGEHVEATGLLVPERRQRRGPPQVGEVLGLVDDDRVEEPAVRLPRAEVHHQPGQLDLPEVTVVLAAGRRAPVDAEVVERADVRGRSLREKVATRRCSHAARPRE